MLGPVPRIMTLRRESSSRTPPIPTVVVVDFRWPDLLDRRSPQRNEPTQIPVAVNAHVGHAVVPRSETAASSLDV